MRMMISINSSWQYRIQRWPSWHDFVLELFHLRHNHSISFFILPAWNNSDKMLLFIRIVPRTARVKQRQKSPSEDWCDRLDAECGFTQSLYNVDADCGVRSSDHLMPGKGNRDYARINANTAKTARGLISNAPCPKSIIRGCPSIKFLT